VSSPVRTSFKRSRTFGLPFMLAEEEHRHTALARTDALDYTPRR
jgi:hypothetical protein